MALKWWRSNRPTSESQAKPDPRADAVLPMVAERMRDFGLDWPDSGIDGPMSRGPGTLAVVLRDNHTEHETHLDLDFVLNVDRPAEATISDCVTGFGSTIQDAWARGVQTWAELTAASIVELLRPANEFAEHRHGNDPTGFPGWHSTSAGFIGFGLADPEPLAQWAADNDVVPRLAPVITAGLDRPQLNGVKLMFGGTAGDEVAEVRINGRCDDAASAALRELSWPRPDVPIFVRSFVLLVHPETDACGS